MVSFNLSRFVFLVADTSTNNVSPLLSQLVPTLPVPLVPLLGVNSENPNCPNATFPH